MPQAELIAAAIVGVAAIAILGLSELVRKLGASKEQSRKAAHVGSGLLACSFPWVFESALTVAILTGGFAALVLVAKKYGQLQGVHGVDRESHGAAVFPLVIALLFWITHGDPLLFSIPILVLTVSDTAAALIGKGYGTKHFRALGEQRSVEGSLAFFTVTFVAVHIPLLLSDTTPRLESVIIAILVAVFATCIEAISVRGLDNLFIPLVVSFSLHNFMSHSLQDLVDRTTATAGFALFAFMSTKLRFVTATGGIAGFLVLYACFSLGGHAWATPLVAALILFLLMAQALSRKSPLEPLGLSRVFQAIIVEVALVFTWHYTNEPALYPAYLAALSGTTALICARMAGQLGSAKGRGPMSAGVGGFLGATVPAAIGSMFVATDGTRAGITAILGGWSCILLVFFLRTTTARFTCTQCNECGHEPRHCGNPATLSTGHRVWTSNRAAMLSIALVAGVAWATAYFHWTST